MNALLTAVPLLLIRFGLLSIISKGALKRAAYFAPLIGKEKVAYWFYQISNIAIFVYLGFIKITTVPFWLYTGLVIYGLGILLCIQSVVDYAKPKYFIYFLGCALLTQSLILLVLLLAFQIATHWIILSEERWCVKNFGEEYIQYMYKVRRYL